MSAVRQLGGNATTMGIRAQNPTREGEIVGQVYIASNLAIGSNVFGTNALDIYGAASVSSTFTTKDQLLASATLNTAIAPSISFAGDTMTGFYRPANQNISLATAGVERLRMTSNGLLGIGITNPLMPVHIVGQTRVHTGANGYSMLVSGSNTGNTEVSGEATGIGFLRAVAAGDVGGKLLFLSDGAGAGRGDFSMQLKNTAAAGETTVEVLRVKNSGRVGVNASNPAYTVDIDGGAGGAGGSGSVGVRCKGSNVTVNLNDTFDIGACSSNGAFASNTVTGDVILRYSGTGKTLLQSGTGATPAITITASNLVGMGTTVPTAALTVAANSGSAKLSFANDTTTNRHIVLWQNPSSNNDAQFIGIGVRPSELRTVVDAPATSFTWVAATGSNTVSELARLTGDGRLGLGTNAPAAGRLLHVAGAAQVDTTAFINTQVLVSTNGSASAPSFSWAAESNLGVYRVGTGTVALVSGGSETVRVTTSNTSVYSGAILSGKSDGSIATTYVVLDGAARRKFALVSSNGASAALSFQMHDSTDTSVYTSWRPLMNLTSNGVLAIGADAGVSNIDLLYVNGAARIASNLHAEGQLVAPAGRTQSTPCYTFTGSTTTGIYAPVVDAVAISTAASERLRVHPGGAVSIKGSSTLRDVNIGGSMVLGPNLPTTNWHDSVLHLSTNTGLCGIGFQSSTATDTNACAIANSNESMLLSASTGGFRFLTGTALSSGAGGTERLRITSAGNVGINIPTSTSLTRDLEILNTARVGSRLYQRFVRTLGTTLNNSTQICALSAQDGGYFVNVSLVQSEASNSVTKGYFIPVTYHCTSNLWKRVVPTNASGILTDNDFDLEMLVNNSNTTLRLIRTAVGTNPIGTNISCAVVVDQTDTKPVTVTDVQTTEVGSTNTGIYPYTPVSLAGGRQAVGATTYRAKFNVNAAVTDACVSMEVNQDDTTRWIFDARSQSSTVMNIQGTGSVGIGKTDNTEKLWVEGTTRLNGNAVIAGQVVAQWGSAVAPSYSFSNSLGAGIYLAESNTVAFATSGAARITLSSNGLVGINTAAPTDAFHVFGNVKLEGSNLMVGLSNIWSTVVSNSNYTASNYNIVVPTDSVTNGNTTFTGGVVRAKTLVWKGAAVSGVLYNQTAPYTNPSSVIAGSLVFEGGSYVNLANDSDSSVQQFGGNVVLRGGLAAVGIGGTGALRALTRCGSIVFETGSTSNANRDASNFFERARIDGVTGYLGVGLSNPSYPLHVAGDIFTSSSLYANELFFTRTIPNQTLGGKVLLTEGSNVRAALALVENVSGNVGVGTAAAGAGSFKLDVFGETRIQSRATFGSNLFIGTTTAQQVALVNINNTTANIAKIHLGDQVNTRRHLVLYQDATRTNNELQFNGFGVQSGTLVYQADTSTAHRFFVAASATSNTEVFTMLSNGNVGVGVTSTTYKMEVAGNIKADNFISVSDRRVKRNLKELRGREILNNIKNLKAYEYSRIDKDRDPVQRRYGFIAQEVEEIFPHAVFTDPETDLKAVAYADLVPVLFEAIKSLQNRIAHLENSHILAKY